MAKASDLFAKASADGETLKAQSEAIISIFTTATDKLVTWTVSAALHVIVHGDYTHIERVEKALSERGFRSNALKAWFTSPKVFGKDGAPLTWKLKDKDNPESKAGYVFNEKACAKLKQRYEQDAEAFTALLLSQPYYKLSKETEYKGFDILDVLRKGVRTGDNIAGDAEKMASNLTKMDTDELELVRKTMQTIAAMRAQKVEEIAAPATQH